MWTQTELQKVYGFTQDQLRARLGLLRGTLGHDVHRGPHGRIVVGDEFRAALDRMVELERRGTGPSQAAAIIAQELEHSNGSGQQASPTAANVAPEVLLQVIEDLRRDRDTWRTLALQLQERTLALPASRQPWWRRLLPQRP